MADQNNAGRHDMFSELVTSYVHGYIPSAHKPERRSSAAISQTGDAVRVGDVEGIPDAAVACSAGWEPRPAAILKRAKLIAETTGRHIPVAVIHRPGVDSVEQSFAVLELGTLVKLLAEREEVKS